jgi:hypothetical protein
VVVTASGAAALSLAGLKARKLPPHCKAVALALAAHPHPGLQVRTHPVLLGEGLGGALYVEDFVRLCRQVGFLDPRTLSTREIEVRLLLFARMVQLSQ